MAMKWALVALFDFETSRPPGPTNFQGLRGSAHPRRPGNGVEDMAAAGIVPAASNCALISVIMPPTGAFSLTRLWSRMLSGRPGSQKEGPSVLAGA
jgi:hypothetical protein